MKSFKMSKSKLILILKLLSTTCKYDPVHFEQTKYLFFDDLTSVQYFMKFQKTKNARVVKL